MARLGYAPGQGHSHARAPTTHMLTCYSRPRKLQSQHHVPESKAFSQAFEVSLPPFAGLTFSASGQLWVVKYGLEICYMLA